MSARQKLLDYCEQTQAPSDCGRQIEVLAENYTPFEWVALIMLFIIAINALRAVVSMARDNR